jgi:hypothetical protein
MEHEMRIWTVAKEENQVGGHGFNYTSLSIKQDYTQSFPPVFKDEQDAIDFAETLPRYNRARVVELLLVEF